MVNFFRTVAQDIFTYRYLYLILLLLAVLMSLTLHSGRRGADGKEYLRWTHSLVFDQDIHLLNNIDAVGGGYRLTPTGYVFERVNIGTPLAWSPFYRLALFFLTESDDSAPADSIVQLLWLNFSSWLYPILGAIVTLGALRHCFSVRLLSGAIIAVYLGTPALFYMVTFPASAHPTSIFLSAILLYLWVAGRQKPSYLYYLGIGVIVGWLMMVASYNVVFWVLPGLDLLKHLLIAKLDQPFTRWNQVLKYGLTTIAGGVLGFLPQMLVWWFVFGHPLYSPYSGQLLWSQPYLLETWFSTFHGLFVYAPVLLLVIPGLWWWGMKDKWAALSMGLVWLTLSYIASINVAWWAGASFGNRYFLSLTPFFVFGLAAFLARYKKWGAVLGSLCVLWTVGLYLQFLNGVGLTSDSFVFPLSLLLTGQLTAFSQMLTIGPQLWVNWPWALIPGSVLPTFVVSFVVAGRLCYGWLVQRNWAATHRTLQLMIVTASLMVVGFVGIAGVRGEQVKTDLIQQGFYDQPYEPIRREIKEIAGKAGLVTRAMYHRSIGRPDRAVADLKLASEIWKRDTALTPQRHYLGPKEALETPLQFQADLDLDYLGEVRLLGYEIHTIQDHQIKGTLYWEKLDSEKSRHVAEPIVRAFDRQGTLLGSVVLDFPFPAHYVPAGGVLKDNFSLDYASPLDDWVWLGVSLAEDSRLPVNALGETESNIIASINTESFPATSLPVDEAQSTLVGKSFLLLPESYQAGEVIPIQLAWQMSQPAALDVQLELSLFDSANELVIQELSARRKLSAESQSSTHCFSLPETLPDGVYTLTAKVVSSMTGYLLNEADQPSDTLSWSLKLQSSPAGSRSSTICNLINTNFSRSYEATAPQYPLVVPLIPAITLAGYDFFVVPQAEAPTATIILHWQVLANVSQNYLISVRLLDAAGQTAVSHVSQPKQGARPTATWLENEWVLDEHVVQLPALAPGRYQLSLSLLDEQLGTPIEFLSGQTNLILQETQIP